MIEEQHTPSRCTFVLVEAVEDEPKVVCGHPAETVDFINGFRCDTHPPRWDQSYAQFQRSIDRPGTADAYRRTMIAFLRNRVTTRYVDVEQAA